MARPGIEDPCIICGSTSYEWGTPDPLRFRQNTQSLNITVPGYNAVGLIARMCKTCGNVQVFSRHLPQEPVHIPLSTPVDDLEDILPRQPHVQRAVSKSNATYLAPFLQIFTVLAILFELSLSISDTTAPYTGIRETTQVQLALFLSGLVVLIIRQLSYREVTWAALLIDAVMIILLVDMFNTVSGYRMQLLLLTTVVWIVIEAARYITRNKATLVVALIEGSLAFWVRTALLTSLIRFQYRTENVDLFPTMRILILWGVVEVIFQIVIYVAARKGFLELFSLEKLLSATLNSKSGPPTS